MAKTYDPGEVTTTFNGVIISGYAPGTFITAEREADAFTKQSGSDGEVTRTRMRNVTGTVTVTLMQESASNTELSGLALVDEQTNLGVGLLQVTNNISGAVALAAEAWIRKVPNMELADESGNRDWVFDCSAIDIANLGQA